MELKIKFYKIKKMFRDITTIYPLKIEIDDYSDTIIEHLRILEFKYWIYNISINDYRNLEINLSINNDIEFFDNIIDDSLRYYWYLSSGCFNELRNFYMILKNMRDNYYLFYDDCIDNSIIIKDKYNTISQIIVIEFYGTSSHPLEEVNINIINTNN